MCKTQIRIDWKFEHDFVLCVSTELCHKICMLGSQNGPVVENSTYNEFWKV